MLFTTKQFTNKSVTLGAFRIRKLSGLLLDRMTCFAPLATYKPELLHTSSQPAPVCDIKHANIIIVIITGIDNQMRVVSEWVSWVRNKFSSKTNTREQRVVEVKFQVVENSEVFVDR